LLAASPLSVAPGIGFRSLNALREVFVDLVAVVVRLHLHLRIGFAGMEAQPWR
jgi:hypothetical protein